MKQKRHFSIIPATERSTSRKSKNANLGQLGMWFVGINATMLTGSGIALTIMDPKNSQHTWSILTPLIVPAFSGLMFWAQQSHNRQ